jgi:hypothetical protein
VGHLLGWKIKRVLLRRTQVEPVESVEPLLADTRAERASLIQVCRDGITVFCAGSLAAVRHQKDVEEKGFANAQEKRGYNAGWEIEASMSIKIDRDCVHIPGDDCYIIVQEAGRVCRCLIVAEIPPQRRGDSLSAKDMIALFKDFPKRRDAEILQAEERADQLLKKHWPAVKGIADALCQSNTGTIPGFRVRTILAKHID